MRLIALLLGVFLSACPAGETIRLGFDSALEEVGLGTWLGTAFERDSGSRAQIMYFHPEALEASVEDGKLDFVVLLSEESADRLAGEGLLTDGVVAAHEELLFVGPAKNLLGKYAHTRGSDLLKNISRTNYRYLVPDPVSVEGLRHNALFRATGDIAKPGSWFSTKLSGVGLVRAAIDRNAFALVRRSSLLLAAREGVYPPRIWAEGDPALVLKLIVGRVPAAKAGQRVEKRFVDWMSSERGGRRALKRFGKDRLGHPIYALGAPKPGEGASIAPIQGGLSGLSGKSETQ